MVEFLYLDHNSTTPLLPEVADAIREASLRYSANPGSQHAPGRLARKVLEDARSRIAEILGARTTGTHCDRLIFTSGGTEANNLAILGMALDPSAFSAPGGGAVVTSAIEHPSVIAATERLQQQGADIVRITVDASGAVKTCDIERALGDDTRLVSIMAANNETGVLQPVEEIAELCNRRGIAFQTDAAQFIGKLPLDFASLNCAAVSCAAHKFHGPPGIGALLVRHDVVLKPQLYGGHQQSAIRPGTETVALAVGMKTALECWQRESDYRRRRITALRDRFESTLMSEQPQTVVICRESRRLPSTSNIAFVGLDRQALLMALDMAGVACSTGSACASGSSEYSSVLLAMGLENRLLEGALRFSFSATTTTAEIDQACRRILSACQHLRQHANC